MRTKNVTIGSKTYTLTIDAMLLFDCQRELKLNLLEKIGELANLQSADDEKFSDQGKALCDIYAAAGLSLARCKTNGFENWEKAVENLSIAEMQQLAVELINSISETNSKN